MQITIVPPGHGQEFTAFGDTIQFKVSGEQCNKSVTIGHASVPPGAGPPLHVHHREDEIFIVESGEIEVRSGGEWLKAPQGSVVFMPRDVPHQFRNASQAPASMWLVCAPGGFEAFFQSASKLFPQDGPPDIAAVTSLAAEHGMEIVGPPPGH